MLLSQFKPDIEQEGDVKFDGYLIEGASPLWCAAGISVQGLFNYSVLINPYYKSQGLGT